MKFLKKNFKFYLKKNKMESNEKIQTFPPNLISPNVYNSPIVQRSSQNLSKGVRRQFTLTDSKENRKNTTLSIRKNKILEAQMKKRYISNENNEFYEDNNLLNGKFYLNN